MCHLLAGRGCLVSACSDVMVSSTFAVYLQVVGAWCQLVVCHGVINVCRLLAGRGCLVSACSDVMVSSTCAVYLQVVGAWCQLVVMSWCHQRVPSTCRSWVLGVSL